MTLRQSLRDELATRAVVHGNSFADHRCEHPAGMPFRSYGVRLPLTLQDRIGPSAVSANAVSQGTEKAHGRSIATSVIEAAVAITDRATAAQ